MIGLKLKDENKNLFDPAKLATMFQGCVFGPRGKKPRMYFIAFSHGPLRTEVCGVGFK